jgi:putative ABC transport system permease protein
VPGVAAAIPVLARRVSLESSGGPSSAHLMSFDMSFDMSNDVPDGLRVDERDRFVPGPGGIVIDRVLADELTVDIGDAVDVLGERLEVRRIEPGGNPLFAVAFVDTSDAERFLALDGYVNFVVLALEPSTTPDPDAIATAAPGTETRSTADYAATMEATVDEGFLPVVGALVAIGLAIGGAVVALTTYTATVERARDFAVLKALGASGWFVYRVVIRQSIVLGLVGSSVGLGAAGFVAAFVRRTVPEFLTDLRWGDALAVSALTLAVSLLAAYLPVRRIDRIDPALVFRA